MTTSTRTTTEARAEGPTRDQGDRQGRRLLGNIRGDWLEALNVVYARWKEMVKNFGEKDNFNKFFLRHNDKKSDILYRTDYGFSEMFQHTPTLGQTPK